MIDFVLFPSSKGYDPHTHIFKTIENLIINAKYNSGQHILFI